jgi:hypothetical protein
MRNATLIAGSTAVTLRCWSCAVALLALILPAQATRAEPLLSYVVEKNGGAEWHIWDAATSQDRVFLELPEAPEHSFWDPAERSVTFVAGGGTYRARYDETPGRAERLGPAPDGPGEIEILWREARDGSLRVISIYVVPEADVIEPEDGSTMPGLPDDEWRYFTVCTEQRMAPPDSWALVERRADTASYEGEICIWLDVTRRRERGASRFALYETYRCARNVGHSEEPYNSELCIEEVPEPLREKFEAYRKSEAYKASGVHYDFVSLLPTDGAFDLAYGAAEGHATHIYGQVFLVAREEGRIEPLQLVSDSYLHQMQIGLAPGFALVAEEYSGATPHVIDLNTGRVVFRAEGRSALWVPQ